MFAYWKNIVLRNANNIFPLMIQIDVHRVTKKTFVYEPLY